MLDRPGRGQQGQLRELETSEDDRGQARGLQRMRSQLASRLAPARMHAPQMQHPQGQFAADRRALLV